MSNLKIIRQPDDLNDKIWRYMDLPKFIYLLDTRKLYLSRADTYEDAHEGATPFAQKNWETQKDPKNSESFADFRYRQREWTFISCWSHRDHESHALWRIFCGPTQGVAICSRYRRLAELMNLKGEDKEVGLVDYGRDEIIPQNTLVPFFRKRKAFAYEQKARFVANIYRCIDVRDQTGKLLGPRPCLQIPLLDLSAFAEAIRIHPESAAGYVDVVKSLVNKYAPELLNRVEPSEMAKPPVF
jgi:hypothetical protein